MAVDTKGGIYEGDLTKLNQAEMEKQAEIFAEGSPALKEILVLLWSNGVQTIGCCSGHKGNGYPQVSFYVDKMSDALLRKILTEVCNNNDEVLLTSITKGLRPDRARAFNRFDKDGLITETDATFRRPINLNIAFNREYEFETNKLLEILKNAFEKSKEVGYYEEIYQKLSEDDKLFIEDAIELKHTDITKVSVEDVRKIYAYFPNSTALEDVEIRKCSKNISYTINYENVDSYQMNVPYTFNFESAVKEQVNGQEILNTKRKVWTQDILASSEYYLKLDDIKIPHNKIIDGQIVRVSEPVASGLYILDQAKKEIIYLTPEEAKEKGILSKKEYEELVEKIGYGREAFKSTISFAKEKETSSTQEMH